jgi:hypothetical protein
MAHKKESRMAIKKLSDGPIEMVIQSARLVEGQYGTQVQFVGVEAGESEDTLLYISERSAVRQIERLALTLESCSGQALRFEQVAKDGKTYNNIYRANAAQGATTMTNATAAVPAPKANIYELYADCLSNAAKMVSAMSEETGITVSGSDIVAAAATLFIQQNRR